MKINTILYRDKTSLLEDISLLLPKHDCSPKDIELVLKYLGLVFFASKDPSELGISALTSEQQQELIKFIKEHNPGKKILTTLLIIYFINSECSDSDILITQSLVAGVFEVLGTKVNISQQYRDYSKSQTAFLRENDRGGLEMTPDGEKYVNNYMS